MVELRADEEYLGYRIEIRGIRRAGDFPGPVAIVEAATRDGRGGYRFQELLDGALLGSEDWSRDEDTAVRQLTDRALHRVRGAIILDRVHELDGGKFYVQAGGDQPLKRSRDYIQRVVLQALERVIHLVPANDGMETFDDIGVCLVEGLDPAELEYVLKRLERAGMIEYWSIGDQPGSRVFRATDTGLLAADRLILHTNAPGFLLEESIAQLDRTLNRVEPALVDKLTELAARVAEARDLTEHDVGEVAQACEQVIQEFLDLDTHWDGSVSERPEKGRTRDRLRILLKAKVDSDTEAEMMTAFYDYVVAWFGRLETFIHKYRHLPGQANRRHAQRRVTYTYLLLADLSELLAM